MNHNRWHWQFALTLAFAVGTSAGVVVVAQDDSPFGEETEPADPVDTPKATKSKGTDEAPRVAVPLHPVLRDLRDSQPTSLDELTRALRISLDLNNADEFLAYAADWLELTPSDENLAALHRKYTTSLFLQMASRDGIQPEGEKIASIVLAGAAKHTRDPVRLQQLVQQLSDPATRPSAQRQLREASSHAAAAMIQALADDAAKPYRAAIGDALVSLGRDSIEPLIAALAAPQAELRADAAQALGRLKARSAATFLAGLAVSPNDTPDRAAARAALVALKVRAPQERNVREYYVDRIRSLLAGELPAQLDHRGEIGLWVWDPTANTVRYQHYAAQAASLVVADRFARQLLTLAGENQHQLRLALLVRLEADQTLAGIDQPLPEGNDTAWALAHSLSIDAIETALSEAIKLDRPTAITAIVQVLGASGRPEILARYPAGESPLVTALGYPDRRVQVAALKAILALDSTEAYPGSSRVLETMRFLLSASGRPRALVAHGRRDEAQRIATLFSEMGFDVESAASGRELVGLAKENADIELILISETIDNYTVQETVQFLRQDPRTARIPLGIMQHFVVLEPRYEVEMVRLKEPLDDDAANRVDDRAPRTVMPRRQLSADELIERLSARERNYPQRLPGRKAEQAVEAVDLAVMVPAPVTQAGVGVVHREVMSLVPTRQVSAELRAEHAYFVLETLVRLLARENPPHFYDFQRIEEAVLEAVQLPEYTLKAEEILALMSTPRTQLALVEQASLPSRSLEERAASLKSFDAAVRRRGLYLTQAQIETQYNRFNQASDEDIRSLLGEVLDVIEAPTAVKRPQQD